MTDAIADLLRRVRQAFAPPPQLRISEFADQTVIVTSGPLAGTHWRTDFAPFQRGIMDAFHEPGVETVVVMGSSQWGKTSIAVNVVLYHMKHDPCPILVVEPTVDPMAKDFARNRLDPVIEASPDIAAVVAKRRSRNAANSTLQKTFAGGSLSVGGANSAASLASRSIRLLVLDEVDRYPPELPGEGNTIAIAIKRTTAFRRRRRVLMLSSPTLVNGPIHRWFQRGDQRRYWVPCPACGHLHVFTWANVRWQDGDPTTARLHCPACKHALTEAERIGCLAKGEWRADEPDRVDRSIVSFHLWEGYSPLSSLAEIVTGFLRAREAQKTGDRSEMHVWQNTTLAEPVEPDDGEGVESHVLLMRREAYDADLPQPVCCLTAGVDVQDDRFEVLVWGWAPGEEAWLVDRQVIPGDTSRPEPWDALTQLLDHAYTHTTGHRLPIHAACIDSAGHRTTLVYDYAAQRAARRLYATIGRDGERPIVSSPSPRRWGRNERQVPLYTVGVDAAKALFVSRLRLTEAGPGFVHLPIAEWCDDELAEQLTSERLVMTWSKGVPRQVWRKRRARNEGLDCAVLAIAALRLLNPKLQAMSDALTAAPIGGGPGTPTPTSPGRRVARSAYLGRR